MFKRKGSKGTPLLNETKNAQFLQRRTMGGFGPKLEFKI
jgi:hypothetical protein